MSTEGGIPFYINFSNNFILVRADAMTLPQKLYVKSVGILSEPHD